jgi:hypothetical protein
MKEATTSRSAVIGHPFDTCQEPCAPKATYHTPDEATIVAASLAGLAPVQSDPLRRPPHEQISFTHHLTDAVPIFIHALQSVFPSLAPASRDRRGFLFAQQFR